MKSINERINGTLQTLFPNFTCLSCGCELNSPKNIYVCDKCFEKLELNTVPLTLADTTQEQYFTTASAPFIYEPNIKKLIMALKYGETILPAETLAPYCANLIKDKTAILIPVPLCKKRLKFRGYNQAEVLAREVAKYTGQSVHADLVVRVKKTSVQKDMGIKERTENLSGAFACGQSRGIRPDATQNEIIASGRTSVVAHTEPAAHYVIIDDVFTTGATANEVAKVLIKAGAKRVDVVAVARVSLN